jgi:hypothetical protein
MSDSDRGDERASVRELQGRVLIHGEEEQGSRHYMLLEGTDARFICCTTRPRWRRAQPGETARQQLRPLRRHFVNGQPLLEIDDRGDANCGPEEQASSEMLHNV